MEFEVIRNASPEEPGRSQKLLALFKKLVRCFIYY